MSLIILKSTFTGLYQDNNEADPSKAIFQVVYFDTTILNTFTTFVTGGADYEMGIDQFIYENPDNLDIYRYGGLGSFYVQSGTGPSPAVKFTLQVAVSPFGSGSTNIVGVNEYLENESVELSANAFASFAFVNWSVAGQIVSTEASFTFTMPAVNTAITANFESTIVPNPPQPEQEGNAFVFDGFYPLELRLSGVQIPIEDITTKIHTGIFSDELIGDYSYPITIPITEKVMSALKLPNDPQSAWNFMNSFPAELWAHGNRRFKGHLDIIDADETAIRTNFVFDSGFFIENNKNIKLRDCYNDEDVITLNPPTVAVGGYELYFNYEDIRLTVNSFSRLFLKAEFSDHIKMLEAMADYLETLPFSLLVSIRYSEDLTDLSSKIISWDTNVVTNMTLVRASGQTSRNIQARRLTSTRFVLSDFAVANEANRIAFPMLYNRKLYDGINSIHDGIVNRYDSEGRLYVGNISYPSFSESFLWENTLVPYLYLTDVVKMIFSHLKISVSGSFFENELVKKMIVYNNRTLDFIQITANGTPSRRTAIAVHAGDGNPNQVSLIYENVHNLNIKLKNHVPNVSIIDFLKALKNYFFLRYDFNILQNKVEIRFIKDLIDNNEVIDFSLKASRVYTLSHNKEGEITLSYEDPDPILKDGMYEEERTVTAQYTVNNYLALDALNAEIDEIAYVRSLRAFFRLTPDQENPPFWRVFAFDLRDDLAPNNKLSKEWSVGMVPLVDAWVDGKKLPSIEMTAYQPEINLFNEDTGIRVTAFYGVQTDAANRPYHFASATKYNAKELASANQHDLDLRSEDMYDRGLKSIETIIRSGKIYETELLLSDVDISVLSRTSKIKIGNIVYLIDEMEIVNTPDEFAIAKVKMWKVKGQ
jgi:hypothetical protein